MVIKHFHSAITMTQEGSANNHLVTKKYVDDEIAKIPSRPSRPLRPIGAASFL